MSQPSGVQLTKTQSQLAAEGKQDADARRTFKFRIYSESRDGHLKRDRHSNPSTSALQLKNRTYRGLSIKAARNERRQKEEHDRRERESKAKADAQAKPKVDRTPVTASASLVVAFVPQTLKAQENKAQENEDTEKTTNVAGDAFSRDVSQPSDALCLSLKERGGWQEPKTRRWAKHSSTQATQSTQPQQATQTRSNSVKKTAWSKPLALPSSSSSSWKQKHKEKKEKIELVGTWDETKKDCKPAVGINPIHQATEAILMSIQQSPTVAPTVAPQVASAISAISSNTASTLPSSSAFSHRPKVGARRRLFVEKEEDPIVKSDESRKIDKADEADEKVMTDSVKATVAVVTPNLVVTPPFAAAPAAAAPNYDDIRKVKAYGVASAVVAQQAVEKTVGVVVDEPVAEPVADKVLVENGNKNGNRPQVKDETEDVLSALPMMHLPDLLVVANPPPTSSPLHFPEAPAVFEPLRKPVTENIIEQCNIVGCCCSRQEVVDDTPIHVETGNRDTKSSDSCNTHIDEVIPPLFLNDSWDSATPWKTNVWGPIQNMSAAGAWLPLLTDHAYPQPRSLWSTASRTSTPIEDEDNLDSMSVLDQAMKLIQDMRRTMGGEQATAQATAQATGQAINKQATDGQLLQTLQQTIQQTVEQMQQMQQTLQQTVQQMTIKHEQTIANLHSQHEKTIRQLLQDNLTMKSQLLLLHQPLHQPLHQAVH